MKRRLFEFVLIPVLLLLVVGIPSFIYFLPVFLEKNILPSLGDQFFTSVKGQVLHIGINKSSISNLTIGNQENIAFKIGSIQAEYSLSSIKNKRIDQVKVDGFTLNLEVSERGVVIPGLNWGEIAAAGRKPKKIRVNSTVNIDWLPDNFRVTNGFINISYQNKRLFIPFDLQITRKGQPDTTSTSDYRVNLQIFPQGGNITVTGSVDLKNNTGMFSLSADSLDIKSLAFLMGDWQKFIKTGQLAIISNAEIKLVPFQLVSSGIDCRLQYLNLDSGQLAFGTPAGNEGSAEQLQLKINGNGSQWDTTAHIPMVSPLKASILLHGKILTKNNSAAGTGNIAVNLIDKEVRLNSGNLPLIIRGTPEIHADFSIDGSPDAWQTDIRSQTSKKDIEIAYGKNLLRSGPPSFRIKGAGGKDKTQIKASLKIEKMSAAGAGESEITLPEIYLQALLNQEVTSAQASLVNGKFEVSLPGAAMSKQSFTANGDIVLTGNMKPQPPGNMNFPQLTGKLVISNANADQQKNNITIKSIQGMIPWQFSPEHHKRTGKIEISGIKWKKNDLGSFEAGISLNEDEYFFDGRFNHSLPEGLVTAFTGQAGVFDSRYQADITLHMDVSPFKAIHLGRFDTSMADSYISGELGLDGKLRYDANGLSGNMAIQVQNGRFENLDKKQSVDNINLSLLLPSLPDIRSAPAQKILFDTASIGDLLFEKGKVIWQLESPESIFVEEGVVRWAGGRVFTSAIRISPEIEELVAPVFCDRLILAEILTQFGITAAAGEGTVSGRIPMHVRKGAIRIEDGFLYSSPGQGGIIKVAAFDLLSAGIPKNSPQFSQIDFAAEALKNFQYNWVRLLLNSEGEDLLMQMQMDGKPVQSLPFSYDSRTGLLQRTDDTKKGIHQPIRLDVNFRLPLNRFLGYSGKIQDIMKNLQ